MAEKWIQTIKQIAPSVTRVGVIFNPKTGRFYTSFLPFIESASRVLDVKPVATAIHNSDHIAQTPEELAEEPNTGIGAVRRRLAVTVRQGWAELSSLMICVRALPKRCWGLRYGEHND